MVLEADQDVVLAKVSAIRKRVDRIRKLRSRDSKEYDDWIAQDVTVLNLQRAAQACLDLANHVIAANGWELPRSARHAFGILAEHQIINKDRLRVLTKVIGFRNIAVHNYTALDPAIVEAIAATHLGDLEAFADDVLLCTPRRD